MFATISVTVPLKQVKMFLTNLFIVTAVIAISAAPHCLADDTNGIVPFLNKPYKLVSTDKNFDEVLEQLGIGWIHRKVFELIKPKLTLTWDPASDTYSLTERSVFAKVDAPFQVVIMLSIPIS